MVTKAVKESELEQANWHWRNTMRTVRFFNLDARASMPFIVLLVYARPITLLLALVTTLIFRFLEMKGLTFPAAMRSLRVWLIGQYRPSWASFRRRNMRDYGQ
ncbi:MAG: type IV secretion protein IcmT [Micavibrio aeruginosavorus]|nr:type IV secretion protein IcmT [Micavibrio aeruginosavorus]